MYPDTMRLIKPPSNVMQPYAYFYADASLANHWYCFPGIFEAIPGIIAGSADFTDADLHNNPIVQHCWRVQVGISVQPLSSLPFLPVLSSFVPFIPPSM
jgi:hypothetical protein